MNFSFKRLDSARTVILVVMAGVAVVTTMGAAVNVRSASASNAALSSADDLNAPLNRVNVTYTPFEAKDYERFAEKIRVLYPQITVFPGPQSIVLSGTTPQSYASWRLAWTSTLPPDGDFRWTLKNFCAVSCDGSYFKAEVAITERKVDVAKGG